VSPGGWVQAPPPAKPATGCATLGIGCILLIGLAIFALVAGLWLFVNNFAGGLGIDETTGEFTECPFLSDEEAREALGGSADASELQGLFEATVGLILDTRALADAPDCWVTEGDRAYVARVAQYQGADADAVYEREVQAAQPTTIDQGGGVSLENEGYFGGAVSGLGDEAFCTGVSPAIMAGVVVHQGDRVVYVSVGPAEEDLQPELGSEGDVVTSPEQCLVAQDVARQVLD
jgi:hypothetical protein